MRGICLVCMPAWRADLTGEGYTLDPLALAVNHPLWLIMLASGPCCSAGPLDSPASSLGIWEHPESPTPVSGTRLEAPLPTPLTLPSAPTVPLLLVCGGWAVSSRLATALSYTLGNFLRALCAQAPHTTRPIHILSDVGGLFLTHPSADGASPGHIQLLPWSSLHLLPPRGHTAE